jgi:transcriptional regulator of acetoin/glycerol metabolism
MPLNLQARLLRMLQERVVTPLGSCKSIAVDVKVVCATHRRLKGLIAEGRFREDLYYRLNGLLVRLPAVRERGDLVALIETVLRQEVGNDAQYTIAEDVWRIFERHDWPGNLRQISNVLRAGVAIAGSERMITRAHLPDDFLDDLAEDDAASKELVLGEECSLEMLEQSAVRLAVERAGGNISVAARQLRISRNTLYRKLKQLP